MSVFFRNFVSTFLQMPQKSTLWGELGGQVLGGGGWRFLEKIYIFKNAIKNLTE